MSKEVTTEKDVVKTMTKGGPVRYNESFESKSSKAKDFVMVIYGSLFQVKGATSVKAKADKTHVDIETNYGSIKLTEPGNYVITAGGSGLEKKDMTNQEYEECFKKLSSSDQRKLKAEKKIVSS